MNKTKEPIEVKLTPTVFEQNEQSIVLLPDQVKDLSEQLSEYKMTMVRHQGEYDWPEPIPVSEFFASPIGELRYNAFNTNLSVNRTKVEDCYDWLIHSPITV